MSSNPCPNCDRVGCDYWCNYVRLETTAGAWPDPTRRVNAENLCLSLAVDWRAEALALRAQVAAQGWRRLADSRPEEGRDVALRPCAAAWSVTARMRGECWDSGRWEYWRPDPSDLWCPLPPTPEVPHE